MAKNKIDGTLGFLLSNASMVLLRQLNRNFQTAGYDITKEQWSFLICLFHEEGETQSYFAEKTLRDKVSITKVLDGLVKRNLVERKPDQKDRRVKRIYLTNQGKKIIPKLKTVALQSLDEAFDGIKKKDLENFKEVLSKINLNLTGTDLLEFINNNKRRWK
ncbi:MAG: MarR family transcriptional regulator [Melioribacteraceae bacterium]